MRLEVSVRPTVFDAIRAPSAENAPRSTAGVIGEVGARFRLGSTTEVTYALQTIATDRFLGIGGLSTLRTTAGSPRVWAEQHRIVWAISIAGGGLLGIDLGLGWARVDERFAPAWLTVGLGVTVSYARGPHAPHLYAYRLARQGSGPTFDARRTAR